MIDKYYIIVRNDANLYVDDFPFWLTKIPNLNKPAYSYVDTYLDRGKMLRADGSDRSYCARVPYTIKRKKMFQGNILEYKKFDGANSIYTGLKNGK